MRTPGRRAGSSRIWVAGILPRHSTPYPRPAMSSPPSRSSPRDPGLQRQTRIRLERKVSLKFKDLEGFVTELSENISMGGMFLRTADPPAPGTLFDFELNLEEEGPLIQGIAEVVWVREQTEGPRHPAGMGVRFLELAPGSRALIYQVVDEHIVAGGEPFELDRAAPAVPPEPGLETPDPGSRAVRAGSYAVLASPQRKQVDGSFRARRAGGLEGLRHRSRRLVLPAGVVLLVGLGALAVYWSLPDGETEPNAPSSTAEARVDATEVRGSPGRDRLDTVVPDAVELGDEAATGSEGATPEQTPGPAPEPATSESGGDGDVEVPGPGRSREEGSAQEPDPATRAPTPPSSTPPEVPPATVLEDVTWRRQGDALVVTLTADGALLDERWDRFRMDQGTPREVVRIRGIRERHRPSIPVAEPELLRIRTGLHRTARGDELHVVLDLGSPRVRLLDAETDGRRLHLTLFEASQ